MEAFGNRALACVELGRLDTAMADYDAALSPDPAHAQAHLGRSQCLLLQGDFARGWREHEWRRRVDARTAPRIFAAPLWLGDSGAGRSMELSALVASLDPAVRVIATGEPLPAFDCHCPLLSLPLALRTTVTTIPCPTAYLCAPAEKAALWRDRLGARTRPRIGLAWAGNPRAGMPYANRMDRQRSIGFERLAPLLALTDCDFYSLQKGDGAVAQLRQSAQGRQIVDWSEALRDFADTAALIEQLDPVISVDTAVTHIAGALGKPIWLLNRFNTCWRWLLHRVDSPWYPTARIFRQPAPGDWSSVIADVVSALRVAFPPEHR